MPTYYEYAVTSKSGINISEIEQYLEIDTSTETKAAVVASIPTRIVTASNRNELSNRSTYYQLTKDEANNLKNYPDVLGVDYFNPEEPDGYSQSAIEAAGGTLDTGSINFNFIPLKLTNELINTANSSSMGNPALILHSFPSSSNILEFIYNTVNNISSPNTPGTGNDLLQNYRSYRTGKNVDMFYCDFAKVFNHIDFFDENGNHRWKTGYYDFMINYLQSNANTLYWPDTRNVYQIAAPTGIHGLHCDSVAAGTFHSNGKDCNIYPSPINNDTYGRKLDTIRAFHENKSINPNTGYKDPLIWGASWGLKTAASTEPNIVTDYRRDGGIVSGSFNLFNTVSGAGQGFRINYENIDYFFISSSVSGENSYNYNNSHTIGNSPACHRLINIQSNNISYWSSTINTRLNFLTSNYDSTHLHLTSSENIRWYITVYGGTQEELEGNGGNLILTMSGSGETKPYYAIDEWAPLGTPIGLNGANNSFSRYAAPRADYFLPIPNADYHGIDNGMNLYSIDNENVLYGHPKVHLGVYDATAQSPAIRIAAQEEAALSGIIQVNSGGNTQFNLNFYSASTDDPFYHPKFDMEVSVTNPLDGSTITGHPYNSYFIPFEGPQSGSKVFYLRNRNHHSVISVGNIEPAKSGSLYYPRNLSNIGNSIDTFLYGNETRAASIKFKRNYISGVASTYITSSIEYVNSQSFHNESSYYNMSSLINQMRNFTQSYNDNYSNFLGTLNSWQSSNDNYSTIPSTGADTLATEQLYFARWGTPNFTPPNKYDLLEDLDNYPIHGESERFAGTSASSPLLAGFIAGYLEENPNANVNDVRNWILDNSLSTIPTGSIPITNLDGYYLSDVSSYPRELVFVSGTVNTRETFNQINYSPYTTTGQFLYPYTNLSNIIINFKNVKISKS